jgi:hypothetical protein
MKLRTDERDERFRDGKRREESGSEKRDEKE